MKLHVQMQITLNQTLMSNYYFNLKFLKLVKTVLASFLVLFFFFFFHVKIRSFQMLLGFIQIQPLINIPRFLITKNLLS